MALDVIHSLGPLPSLPRIGKDLTQFFKIAYELESKKNQIQQDLEKTIGTLKNQNQQLRQELETACREISALKSQSLSRNIRDAELAHCIQKLEKDLEDKTKLYQESCGALEIIHAQHDFLKQQKRQMEQEFEKSTQTIASLKLRLESLTSENTFLKKNRIAQSVSLEELAQVKRLAQFAQERETRAIERLEGLEESVAQGKKQQEMLEKQLYRERREKESALSLLKMAEQEQLQLKKKQERLLAYQDGVELL